MVDRNNRNRRVGVGSMGHALSSAESGGISGGVTVDVDRVIKGACRGFARAADWRQVSHVEPRDGAFGAEGPGMDYRLSEDHEGLHSGRYISVSVMRAANAVTVKGGYYDGYWQPRTVCRESVPLKEVTSQTLGRLLREMHNKLCDGDRAQATESPVRTSAHANTPSRR
jgi:hypothetical protein